jgi:[protein-PII] uridylyltransferase
MLCTWDRHGLLAKCAACFSASKLDILEANVFTRADNVVLDVFRIWDTRSPSTASPARLQEMMFLLDGALSDPPRFASVWACSWHKHLASVPRIPHRVSLDNDSVADSIVVRVEASDRLGLLYDILQAITDSGLNITQARVETDGDVARDTFHVLDAQGRKLLDPGQQERLHRCLDAALTFTQ